ncbi:MAG: glycerophosphodiester phosphodiesterase family protein [Gammaproteobacteria bacterium]
MRSEESVAGTEGVPHARPALPQLVAHRGYARQYPENTLPSVEAALTAGARYVEVDVQLSADGVPVLFHDADLARTTGRDGTVMALDLETLRKIPAGEPQRFGERFKDVTIPTLAELIILLQAWPVATVFVELKAESLAHFGDQAMVETVMAACAPCGARCIPISYQRHALEMARHHGAARIGWVLRKPDEAAWHQARELQPDFLFCNHTKLDRETETPLWPGPWHWALYEITDAALALDWFRRGADYIETMAVGELLRHPLFSNHGKL